MGRLLFAAVLLVGTATAAIAADGYNPPDRMVEWGPTKPQPGYIQFCKDYYDGSCGPYSKGDGLPVLTAKKLEQLEKVNSSVNRHVTPTTDVDLWGVVDHWSYPVQRDGGLYGDCEDYVLEKRRLLMEMGWPAHALLITVVFDEEDAGHAILTVATEQGDLILDNMHSKILHWHETPYRFVKRQSVQDPNQWAALRRGSTIGPDVTVAGSD